ncbi:MAG: DUF4143 domain-containing protein [Vulcanimicrobiota bacterium]
MKTAFSFSGREERENPLCSEVHFLWLISFEGYLEILEDLLLGFLVKNFTRRAKRHLIAYPKFYFVDCGIYNALRPYGPLALPSEKGGAALEGLVAQHLRAWIDYVWLVRVPGHSAERNSAEPQEF